MLDLPAPAVRLVRRLLAVGGFEARRIGTALLVTPADSDHLKQARAIKDVGLAHQLRMQFARSAVSCVLDVGANRGQYAIALRRLGYRGHIVSFEPIPELAEHLRRLARSDPLWSIHELALGTADGGADLGVMRNHVFSSFWEPTAYCRERFGDEVEVVRTVRVEVRRLDSVLDEVTAHIPAPRIFLKIDTQGHDLAVFEGLGGRAERLVGLQSEVSARMLYEGVPTMGESIARYRGSGFEIAGLFPVVTDPVTLSVIEFDCVMVRPEAVQSAPPCSGRR
jgi:FkbM family methyltransferase